jgi:tellurite resistance protein
VTWWAVSFPLAASTVAALHFAASTPGWINEGIALTMLGATTSIVLWLLVRTTIGMLRGELRQLIGMPRT